MLLISIKAAQSREKSNCSFSSAMTPYPEYIQQLLRCHEAYLSEGRAPGTEQGNNLEQDKEQGTVPVAQQ